MLTIHKYSITSAFDPVSEVTIDIPRNSVILDVQIQNNQICIWANVDTEEYISKKTLIILGTGHERPEGSLKYLGTVQTNFYVWHIFESLNI